MSSRRLASCAVLALALLALPGLAREVPFLAGRVNDLAELIPPDQEARITAQLEGLEQKTGAQVVVLTIDSLAGEPLEEYAIEVAETWKLGRAEADDGVLFLVAKNDRKMRIEVGQGAEAVLPDALAGRILNQIVRPKFRAGDFAGGIEAGVERIVGTLDGSLPPLAEEKQRHGGELSGWAGLLVFSFLFLATVGVFSFAALFADGFGGWGLYLFLLPFWWIFPGVLLGATGGAVTAGAWLLGFPILRLLVRRTSFGKKLRKMGSGGTSGGSWWSSSGGGWGGGGGGWSGGSSGGGFSGGGGSFGGGGASSSW